VEAAVLTAMGLVTTGTKVSSGASASLPGR